VFAIAALVDDRTHLAALCLSTPDAAASHRAAALLLGLDGVDEDVVEVTVAGGGRPRRANVHRSTDLVPRDLVVIDGVRCTNATRTLCDLGATCPDHVVEMALESSLHLRLTTISQLERRCAELARRGRAGTAALRRVLDLRNDAEPTESTFETIALQYLRAAGAPEPVRQHVVRHEGHFVARLDAAWIPPRLYLELDSRAHHGTWSATVRDNERGNRLTAAGWSAMRYSWRRFATERAATATAAEITAIVASRMAVSS